MIVEEVIHEAIPAPEREETIAHLALAAADQIYGDQSGSRGLLHLALLEIECFNLFVEQPLTAENLVARFYNELGFKGAQHDPFAARYCNLAEVLIERQGNPLTLGILLLHLAEKLGIPLRGICFPTYFILGAAGRYLDPLTAEWLSERDLALRLRGDFGPLAELNEEHLATSSEKMILERLLSVAKISLMREKELLATLRASELLLQLYPDDPIQLRDRGLVYKELDCLHQAAEDFSHFIEAAPDDPAARLLALQIACWDLSERVLH